MTLHKTDHVILVTGGSGSIGGALVRTILNRTQATVRVFSRNDSEQHEFAFQIPTQNKGRLRMIIGDVRDQPAVQMAMRGVTVVYHCAAIKHVGAASYNALEAAKTNIIGTGNVLHAAQHEGVSNGNTVTFVLLSTDKAANPANVMGATKLVAEQLVMQSSWADRLRLRVCRFGNVFDSRGSVFPIFLRQLRAGITPTVTDPNATRYIISIRRAVETLLHARAIPWPEPTIVIPRMRSTTVYAILRHAHRYLGLSDSTCDFTQTGLTPGEKLHEACLTKREQNFVLDKGGDFVYVVPDSKDSGFVDLPELLSSAVADVSNTDDAEPYYSTRTP